VLGIYRDAAYDSDPDIPRLSGLSQKYMLEGMNQSQIPQGRIAIVGIPSDENSSFIRGAAEAPARIREALASDSSNLWTESGIDLGAAGLLTDVGDVTPGPGVDYTEQIEESITSLIDKGTHPLVLGGDHAITYPIVRAAARRWPRLSILHFDAHPDLYDDFRGNRLSHACPFARIMEEGLAGRLVQVGIRAATDHQRDQASRFGVEVIEMRDWSDDRMLSFGGPLYISFDIDALDPAFAPGVSHREPGGLSVRQALRTIQRAEGRIVGADIVEFNPRMDASGLTASVGAKLLKEIAGRMLADNLPVRPPAT
jgi:arginase